MKEGRKPEYLETTPGNKLQKLGIIYQTKLKTNQSINVWIQANIKIPPLPHSKIMK